MSIQFDLVSAGNFNLLYHQTHTGNSAYKGYKIPLIEIIELPFSIAGRLLAIGTTYIEAPPTWKVAGTLFQQVGGLALNDSLVFPGVGGSGTAVVDSAQKRVLLNTLELHLFDRYATEHSYRFEPVYWMPKLTLTVWEYVGTESDSTEDLLNAVRVDLVRIEAKIGAQ